MERRELRVSRNARANTNAGLAAPDATDALFAKCAPADPPTACKIAANDPAVAEVCAGLELPPGTEDEHESRANADVEPGSRSLIVEAVS
jgi:hypothetical protein